MMLDMLSAKGPIDTIVGSDTGRHMGMPPTPTALTVSSDAFKFVDFVGFNAEREAPVSTRNDVDRPFTFIITLGSSFVFDSLISGAWVTISSVSIWSLS